MVYLAVMYERGQLDCITAKYGTCSMMSCIIMILQLQCFSFYFTLCHYNCLHLRKRATEGNKNPHPTEWCSEIPPYCGIKCNNDVIFTSHAHWVHVCSTKMSLTHKIDGLKKPREKIQATDSQTRQSQRFHRTHAASRLTIPGIRHRHHRVVEIHVSQLLI